MKVLSRKEYVHGGQDSVHIDPATYGKAHNTLINDRSLNGFRRVANAYTGVSSDEINKAVVRRNSGAGVDPVTAKDLDHLSSGLRHPDFKLTHPGTVWTHVYAPKGIMMTGSHPLLGVKKAGDTIHLDRYVSATQDFSEIRANTEVKNKFPGQVHHVIQWNLPAGYNKGASISHISKFTHEREFLMDHGQKFRFTGKDTKTFGHFSGSGPVLHIWHFEPVAD